MTTVLWGRANAYNVMKVACVLHELGMPHTHQDVGSTPGDLDTDAFRLLNPRGRVPVLQIDGQILVESNSICRYLAESAADHLKWPQRAGERAALSAWMDWELATWQPDFMTLFWSHYRCPQSKHDTSVIEAAASRCAAHLVDLAAPLQDHPWLGGEQMSVADIACSIGLHRYLNMDFPVDPPKAVRRWVERLSTRPAWQLTAMAPFSDLRGREAY